MHDFIVAMNNYFLGLGLSGLALNSFIESFLLVPPPDFLLITMDLAKPEKSLIYALVCTIASAFGGATGYLIGKFGGRPVFNFFMKNKQQQFENVERLYNKYGTLAVFFSAFTPIPYKVFTIASGILNMSFWKFFIASFFGRGARFFLVSIVIMIFGEAIKSHIEMIVLAVTLVIVAFYWILYKKRNSLTNK